MGPGSGPCPRGLPFRFRWVPLWLGLPAPPPSRSPEGPELLAVPDTDRGLPPPGSVSAAAAARGPGRGTGSVRMEPLGALDRRGPDGGRGAGLGPGGLQEPLARPPLRPAPFPFLLRSGELKDAPRTSCCDPGRGPGCGLGRLPLASCCRKCQS
ncbi:unnamed protein product [Pipistrellus nathusii]|uniref:Uncharacterized protein n=1 Tax=Pipistrellus nathusii TaxID=59473 RepID=A0ABN9Z5L0_PIPNA